MDAPVEWEEAHRPLIGRLAGAIVLMGLAPAFVDPAGTSSKLFANLSAQQIVDWAARNGSGISLTGFVDGLQNSLLAVAIVLLIRLIRGRAFLAVGAGAMPAWLRFSSWFMPRHSRMVSVSRSPSAASRP